MMLYKNPWLTSQVGRSLHAKGQLLFAPDDGFTCSVNGESRDCRLRALDHPASCFGGKRYPSRDAGMVVL